ncbi:MAG TPA: hypothetical protein VFN56_00330 [Candidatus Saccharimonadales bacterium]|nr:hypothetical protein [Candidatus Saccharimonadales bacterium]
MSQLVTKTVKTSETILPSQRLSVRELMRFGSVGVAALATAVGIGQLDAHTPPKPVPPIVIPIREKPNPALPTYKVTMGPDGTISHAVDVFAAAEGYKASSAVQERENTDSHLIASVVSPTNGELNAGDSFEVQTSQPITNTDKLYNDLSAIVKPVNSAGKS